MPKGLHVPGVAAPGFYIAIILYTMLQDLCSEKRKSPQTPGRSEGLFRGWAPGKEET